MSHYDVLKNEYTLVDTEKIEIDRIVANTLYQKNIDCNNPRKTRAGIVSVLGVLSRIDDIEKVFKTTKFLPVKLQKHEVKIYKPPQLRKAGENPVKITSILDGRHRVALSIINGYSKVPAIIFSLKDLIFN